MQGITRLLTEAHGRDERQNLSSGNVNADTVRTRPLLPCLGFALHGGMQCVHAGGVALMSFVD